MATGITQLEYQATGLTTGVTYKYKVESRNEFGYSASFSNEISVLQAVEPETPDAPTTSILNNLAVIDWDAPYWNGAVITSYRLYV